MRGNRACADQSPFHCGSPSFWNVPIAIITFQRRQPDSPACLVLSGLFRRRKPGMFARNSNPTGLMPARLTENFPLRPNRVHEVCGAGAAGFAAIACARASGPLLWLREGWREERLNPVGLIRFFDPHRLLVAEAANQTDVLASAEEALRDGSVALVILELSQPLGLTEGRRLQLAAKTGRATGLCLIGEEMGSNAAETRWRAAPLFDPEGADSTLMRWSLIKNKSGTFGAWDVRWDHASRRLSVVSPVGERPGSEGAPG
ncbi:MAG: ImuA family protein [Albidovulum sp.]